MTDQEIDEVSKPFCGCWSDEDEAALDYRTFARALLSRAIPEGHVVVPGWQPIESAPALNGGSTKAVLVWCPSNLCMFTAHFDQDFRVWKYFSGNGGVMFVEPTHWMPLPAAPANKEGA